MDLRETDLPGIGRKYSLETGGGDKLVVVVHNDGRRELYHMNPDDPDEIYSTLSLDDEESRLLSGILAGLTYKPKALENLEMAFDDLVIEWIRIEPHFHCIGLPIGELDIRSRTGATIIAMMENKGPACINPGPDYSFTSRATAVVAGDRTQLKALKQLLASGSG
ncbi:MULTISPECIES: cation:proton antiporter regulatory subunit [unclassified Paenibacillus]|uniref:cation:proton antiporter regulatory subunit n=1 Tax=Paenibacillus sp. cl123 TaxID=1761875 RepID=UPI0009303D93|nr:MULTISPECIES: cation:proton antiporter regulatory subunit [unclassified Paenibacillus]